MPHRIISGINYNRFGMQQGVVETVLKHGTNGLMPAGGYAGHVKYSKKALMWLVHME